MFLTIFPGFYRVFVTVVATRRRRRRAATQLPIFLVSLPQTMDESVPKHDYVLTVSRMLRVLSTSIAVETCAAICSNPGPLNTVK
jgi:hypothetical protein